MASPVHTYFHAMVEIGVVKFCVDHDIFRAIPLEDTASVSYADLAARVGVELNLLERFLNLLVATRLLAAAPAPGHVAHTASSRVFVREDAARFYQHVFDYFLVSAARWPEYFAANGAMEPKRADRAPYGLAAGFPDKTLYEILDTMPEKEAEFNATMALALAEMPATGTYDFGWVTDHLGKEATQAGDQRVILVDVGGGKGQSLKAVLEQNAHMSPSRCVLEDQSAEAVNADTAGVMGAVGRQVASFFEKQPIQGALLYQVRRVLNDWPDEACVDILGRLREACAPDSRVLVAESLLPSQPSDSIDLCAVDLFMMNFGGKRRTQEHYAQLAARAGFRVSSVSKDASSNFAVVEMVPVEAG